MSWPHWTHTNGMQQLPRAKSLFQPLCLYPLLVFHASETPMLFNAIQTYLKQPQVWISVWTNVDVKKWWVYSEKSLDFSSTFSNQWIHQFYAPFISEKDWQYSTAVWSISKPNWPQVTRSGNCRYWYCFLMKPHLSVMHFAYTFAQLAASNTPLWALPGCWTWFHVPQGQRPKHHLHVPGSVSCILVGWFKKPRNPVCQFVRSLQYSLHLQGFIHKWCRNVPDFSHQL